MGLKKLEVVFSNGKEERVETFEINEDEEDMLIESLGHDCEDGWYIDEVFYK
jgi:hypothetical protein